MKNNLLIKVAALLMCLALLAGCGSNASDASSVASKAESKITSSVVSSAVASKEDDGIKDLGTFEMHTELQKTYLSTSNYRGVTGFANGTKELSRPEPIIFNIDGDKSKTYHVFISKDKDFADAKELTVTGTAVSVYNLEIGRTYYCKATADGTTEEKLYKFSTSPTGPRNIYVDGVTNVRDLGGWATADGKKVRQGMMFRGGRLNQSNASSLTVEVTDAGKATMLNDLGIKSEIDLRISGSETGGIPSNPTTFGKATKVSVLGDSVNYFACPMEYNGDILLLNTTMVKALFNILSDEANYPLYFHCNIGTDRTGMVAYLVNALLGVSKDDLYNDYVFSNFGSIGGSREAGRIISSYGKTLDDVAGATLSEKTRNYLKMIGIPEEQINSVIRIMTEE